MVMPSLSTARVDGEGHPDAVRRDSRRVAYLVSRFPKLTETFVINEIQAIEEQGLQADIYPLFGEDKGQVAQDGASLLTKMVEHFRKVNRDQVMHADARRLAKKACYLPLVSLAILWSQLVVGCRSPRAYCSALWAMLRGTWGSANFFIGGLAIFPKAVHMARLIQRSGARHVHAHFANHPTTAAFIIGRLTGVPYSFTAHGSDLHRDQHMLREKVREASFVVAISSYNRDVIVRTCGASVQDRVRVIHCGVDTSRFLARSQPVARPPEAPFRMVAIGTLHEVKGFRHLIEACGILSARSMLFECRIVGDGPERQELQRAMERLELAGRVTLLGVRDREAVIDLLQSADVFVAPSVPSRSGRREGIPVVLMEAMACGVPVIASDLSGIPELVKHESTGLLAPPGDASALAESVCRLAHDPALRERLKTAGRQAVENHFDLRRNAATLAGLFLNGSAPQPRAARLRLASCSSPAYPD